MFVSREAAILHADLDAFFASVEQRDEQRLRGRPVLVGMGVVLAASYEAKAFGIRTAMSERQARRLCPHAISVRPRFSAYVEASKAVFEVFENTSPVVEGISIDEAFLDVRGMERAFGTPVEIAERPAARRPRASRASDHGRRREDEVPRQGRERGREAGRSARRSARQGARVPPSAPGRAALGCRPRHGGEAARAGDREGAPGGAAAGVGARLDARARVGPSSARARAQPRSPSGSDGPATRLDRLAACARAPAHVARGARRVADRPRRPGHAPAASGATGRPNGRAAAALRRLLAGDAGRTRSTGRRRRPTRSWPLRGACWPRRGR